MDDVVKQAWVDALRSGEYKQTREVLASDQGMCCLGVLLHINGLLTAEPVGTFNGEESDNSYENCRADNIKGDIFFPSAQALSRVGLDGSVAHTLAEMNDEGSNFEVIADAIEEMVY